MRQPGAPRATPGTARLELTPAQARLINAALAYWEADAHEDGDGYDNGVMVRTRGKVHRAMARAGIQP